ncbi:SDR family oxidoreductase [Occultella kanbiaonis]|uniref:SDR family oxidoreductase n=1 Tax=Occultella kanbiaonis TaxID=2675754 RepID=UPI00143D9507
MNRGQRWSPRSRSGGPGSTRLGALVRQLAVDHGTTVRVNAILPGAIETPLWARRDEGFREEVCTLIPMARLDAVDEVASSGRNPPLVCADVPHPVCRGRDHGPPPVHVRLLHGERRR